MRMIGKILIFCATVLVTGNTCAVLLCEEDPGPVSPASCSSYQNRFDVNSNEIWNCTGGNFNGSTIWNFFVYAGCGPSGPGSVGQIVNQSSYGIKLASNYAGRYCYCQIRRIGNTMLPTSQKWLYVADDEQSDYCGYDCSRYCAETAMSNTLRAKLFSALQ